MRTSRTEKRIFFFLAVGAITAIIVLPAGLNRASSVTIRPTGLLVPLYTPAGDSTWSTLIQLKGQYPSVPIIAIINPDSGPGVSSNSTFVSGIQSLQTAGIDVVGYLPTNYASASLNLVRNETIDYANWYHVNGIFFDSMSNVQANVTYYSTVSTYAHSLGLALTIGNPGTSVPASFIGTMNILSIYENSVDPPVSTISSAAMGYDRSNFAMIAYNGSVPTQSYLDSIAPYVSYVYFTDGNGLNPFAGLTSYLNTLALELLSIDGPVTSANNLMGPIMLGNNDSTLTFNTGLSHITVSLNLAEPNVWTSAQTTSGSKWITNNGFAFYVNLSDANPELELVGNGYEFGPGGNGALDTLFSRNTANPFGTPFLETQPLSGSSPSGMFVLPSGSNTQTYLGISGQSAFSGAGFNFLMLASNYEGSNQWDFITQTTARLWPIDVYMGTTPVFQFSPTGVGNTQGFQSIIAQPLTNGGTTTTVRLPVPEPDTVYAVTCTISANLGAVWVTGKATNQFVINTNTTAGSSSTADCIITHQ